MLNIYEIDYCISEGAEGLGGLLSTFAAAAKVRIDDARARVRAIASLDEPLTMAGYELAQDAALDALAVCAEWERINSEMPPHRYSGITANLAEATVVRAAILKDMHMMNKCIGRMAA